MGVEKMIRTIKRIHKEDVVLMKVGTFYNVYGKDAYIVSYLFGYKLKEVEEIKVCGFPKASINKVIVDCQHFFVQFL